MEEVGRGIPPTNMPEKAVFGLPQNYRFSNTNDVDFSLKENNQSRRASPLFIHLHSLPTENILIHTVLPAVFLQEGATLHFKTSNNREFELNYQDNLTNWVFIDRYLNRQAFIMGDTV